MKLIWDLNTLVVVPDFGSKRNPEDEEKTEHKHRKFKKEHLQVSSSKPEMLLFRMLQNEKLFSRHRHIPQQYRTRHHAVVYLLCLFRESQIFQHIVITGGK